MNQKGTRVTCEDLETGETESKELRNDWMLVTDGTAYVHHITRHANGTVILTIKHGEPTPELRENQ